MIDKRSFMLGSAALAAGLALPARAQTPAPAVKPIPYPHRVVTVVTHSSPGGGSDVFLREMLRYLAHISARRSSSRTTRAASARRRWRASPRRGPTAACSTPTSPTYILTSLLSRPDKDLSRLEPVVNFFIDTEVAYTRADGPYRTLEDVMNRARRDRGRWGAANPASLRSGRPPSSSSAPPRCGAAVVSHNGGGDLMINVLNGTLEIGVGEMEEIRCAARRRHGSRCSRPSARNAWRR